MPRYEYRDKKSSKFWNIERTDDGYEVTYGATGTTGRSQSKTFATAEEAQEAYDTVVASKEVADRVDGEVHHRPVRARQLIREQRRSGTASIRNSVDPEQGRKLLALSA